MERSLRSGITQSSWEADSRLSMNGRDESHLTDDEKILLKSHRIYSSGKEGSSQEKDTVRFCGTC